LTQYNLACNVVYKHGEVAVMTYAEIMVELIIERILQLMAEGNPDDRELRELYLMLQDYSAPL